MTERVCLSLNIHVYRSVQTSRKQCKFELPGAMNKSKNNVELLKAYYIKTCLHKNNVTKK